MRLLQRKNQCLMVQRSAEIKDLMAFGLLIEPIHLYGIYKLLALFLDLYLALKKGGKSVPYVGVIAVPTIT